MRCYNGVRLLDRPSPANVLRLDLGCLPLIVEMQRTGIRIDPGHFARLHDEITEDRLRVEASLRSLIGYDLNPGSSPQVGKFLTDYGISPPGKRKMTATGLLSTDDDVLAACSNQHPAIELIRDWRELKKLDSTYVLPFPLTMGPDGRVRTLIRATRTTTGRLATGDADQGLRNLQNIPVRGDWGKRVKNGFVSGAGNVLVSLDLAQIEMVWTAHLSQDPVMMEVYHQGLDLHTQTALKMFRLPPSAAELPDFKHRYRLPAKTLGFGILYGLTAQGLQLNIMAAGGPYREVVECQKLIDDWFRVYAMVLIWMDLQYSRASRFGMVWDPFGRIRRMPNALSKLEWVRSATLREAGNMPIQSAAQGVIKLAMAASGAVIDLFRRAGAMVLPLIQIHDELLFEVSRSAADDFIGAMKPVMEKVVQISVPIRSSGDKAERWGDTK